jgi:phage baseplate assembly protein gpV
LLHTVKKVSGSDAASSAQAGGNRQALLQRRGAVFGVAAALHQRAHQVAPLERAAGQVAVDDFARHFQARQVGRAGRHRIVAEALQHVGTVDAGGVHLDQHFAGLEHGQRPLAQLQDIGRARLGDFDGAHGVPPQFGKAIVF